MKLCTIYGFNCLLDFSDSFPSIITSEDALRVKILKSEGLIEIHLNGDITLTVPKYKLRVRVLGMVSKIWVPKSISHIKVFAFQEGRFIYCEDVIADVIADFLKGNAVCLDDQGEHEYHPNKVGPGVLRLDED